VDKTGKGILGRKLGMTQVFGEDGRVIPVTVIEAGPCVVVQRKTTATDGYEAVQLGFGEVRERKVIKPARGHFKRAGVPPCRWLRELRVTDAGPFEVGQRVTADVFAPGDLIDITGTSRGKGFAGGVRRWGFHRGPMTHGSKYHRGPGSLQSRDASRVFKGRRLPGRMGGERVTVQGLRVVRVDPEKNLILVRGAVPGPRGVLVAMRSSVKA
jgi:large subunit ribosomal protein L3